MYQRKDSISKTLGIARWHYQSAFIVNNCNITSPENTRHKEGNIAGNAERAWLHTWWATRHIHACSVIANKVLFNRTTGPRIAILSISVHLLTVVIAWCAVRAISAPADFEQTLLLIPPIALITMLPISIAGWGVREATMMVAFGYAGLNQTDGTMISLLSGVTSFAVGAIGGLVWVLSREKAEKIPGAMQVE
jgi:hypothetical protein